MMIIYSLVYGTFLICAFVHEIGYMRSVRREITFLSDFDNFLSYVRHFYYYTNSAGDAIFYSIPKCSKRLKNVLEEILAGIEKEDRAAIIPAISDKQHKFVRLFMSLTMLVSENGDAEGESDSVFLDSVMQLRSDVQDEKRYLERKRHRYAGLGLTAAIPPIAVPFVAIWGSDTIPSLKAFYYGRNGVVMLCSIFVLTILCYLAILYLREGKKPNLLSKINLKSKMNAKLLRSVYASAAVIVMISVLIAGHFEARKLLTEDVSDIDNVSDTADGAQLNVMRRVIPEYMEKLIAGRMDGAVQNSEELAEELLERTGIRSKKVAEDTAEELLRRLERYKKERFDIIDILIVIAASGFAWIYPALEAMFRSALSDGKKQDEVMQFQSLIHMQKRVPGITTVEILESMESFADIFKPGLQQCLNNFNVNDMQALSELSEAETYPEFRKIIDCFTAVDEAGVENAFDEVTAQIRNFKENREQDRLILLDNNVLLASLLAVLPGGMVLFGYLLIPFMVRAMTLFNNYQDALRGYITSA